MVSKTRRNRHRTRKGGSREHTKRANASRLSPDSLSRQAEEADAKGKEVAVKAQAAAKLAEREAYFAKRAASKADDMALAAKPLTYRTGTYKGGVEGESRHGYGQLKGHDTKYRGEWKDNKKHGFGVYVQKPHRNREGYTHDGYTYEGEWKDNEMNGYGICVFTSGDSYKGHNINSEFDGYGVYLHTGTTGGVSKCEFKQGVKDGFGTYDSDTMSHSGLYLKDKFVIGRGTIQEVAGIYSGDLKGDLKGETTIKHGNGTYTYSNGDVYEGQFKNNKPYGKGKLTKFDGTVEEGIWSGSKMTGKITHPPGAGLYPVVGKFDTGAPLVPIQEDKLSGDDTEPEL
jgi:hypothetical protein